MLIYRLIPVIMPFLLLFSCADKQGANLMPEGYPQQGVITIGNGDLRVKFVDNEKFQPVHEAGYNGIAELVHSNEDTTVFVPFYAGVNLEHIFGGDSLEQLFEPRKHPMSLFQKIENEVLLYQKPTPVSGVESLTEFKVVEPYYIDITFRCVLHRADFFQHGYAGFFWASYINHPEDKKIYFRGTSPSSKDAAWIGAYSTQHGLESTHKSIDDNFKFFFADNFNATLASNFSEYRFSAPFYFGRFHDMVLAYLFKSDDVIRFSQSPTGGGATNPAWDFQYLIPDPQNGREYSFKARVIYKPFVNEEDILREYEKWK